MKHIKITERILDYAKQYLDDVRNLPNKPEDRLRELINALTAEHKIDEADYVDVILRNYDKIITFEPDKYLTDIVPMFSIVGTRVDLSLNFSLKGFPSNPNKTFEKSFYMFIVDALGYVDIKEKIFPDYVRKLNIKTCVYCDAQYAVSARKGKTNRSNTYVSTYNIDHYMPKSLYPYLATSFFNLYPCCSTCNQFKSTKDPIFRLYAHVAGSPFKFSLDRQSFIKYSMSGNSDDLRIVFGPNIGTAKLDADNYDNYFHINKVYANFNDTVEEVIWKYRAHNNSAMTAWTKAGFNFLPRKADVNRFILGNYDDEEDIFKRPLAKLVQDIAKQLGILI